MSLTLYAIVIWLATGTLIGMYYMGLFIGALIIRFWKIGSYNMDISTYIMKHRIANRYYVGKTVNIARRMKEHLTDLRSGYTLVWSVRGDYESDIKRFGVKKFLMCMTQGKAPDLEA